MSEREYAGTATMRGGEIVAWRDVDLTRFEVRQKDAAPFVRTAGNNGADDPNQPGDQSWAGATRPRAHSSGGPYIPGCR